MDLQNLHKYLVCDPVAARKAAEKREKFYPNHGM